MGVFPKQTHRIIVICNCNTVFFPVIVLEELFSKVIVTYAKVIYNSLYIHIPSIAANLQNIRFVCMLFQLLVIVNNVQTKAEPLLKNMTRSVGYLFYGFRNTCSVKQCRSSKPITNWGWLWLHTFLAHTKGMVSDMCRQTTNVILEWELQLVLNSK